METFGSRLQSLRNRFGLTQEEFAKKFRISKSAVGMYERNEREPSFDLVKKFAEFFGVSTDYLLCLTDDPSPPPSKDDDIGPEPHRNPLGIELTPEQVELLREMRDDPEVLGMFRDFANSTEDERRMMLEIWETIRRRRKNSGHRND